MFCQGFDDARLIAVHLKMLMSHHIMCCRGNRSTVKSFVFILLQENSKVALVQEFCEQGDLLGLLRKNCGRLSERVAVQLVLQPLVSALLYLHARGVTHR